MRPRVLAIGAALLVLLVVSAAVVWNLTKDRLDTVTLTAQFDNAAGLYENNTVAVLVEHNATPSRTMSSSCTSATGVGRLARSSRSPP